MASTSTYLNFPRNTAEAFDFYKSVFGNEFTRPPMRFGDLPPMEGCAPTPDADKDLIMHVELPIVGGHKLMGSDAPETMGFTVVPGNNVHINIQPDTREETKELFDKLSAGGKVGMEMQDMFWGDYFGSCTDKFGIHWMLNCPQKQ